MLAQALDGHFQAFLNSKTPTPDAYGAARNTAETVVFGLRRAFYPLRMAGHVTGDSLVVGGVGKRTALNPIRTVDVLYILPSKIRSPSAEQALQIIKAGLSEEYSGSDLGVDELGVMVALGDLTIRVIPAVKDGHGFAIPNPDGCTSGECWRATNPVAESAALRLSDQVTHGKTRQLLTLLKCWKDTVNLPLPSLALEYLVQDYLTGLRQQHPMTTTVKEFMAWVRSRTPGTLRTADRSSEILIDDSWHGLAKAAYWRATLAENAGPHDAGAWAGQWQSILGADFPSADGERDGAPVRQAI